MIPYGTNGYRTHAFDSRILRHEHKNFEQREGETFEDIAIADLDIVIAQLEAIINHLDHFLFVGAQDRLVEMLQKRIP